MSHGSTQSRQNRFQSLSSAKAMDENFRIGDFSAKHFARKGSVGEPGAEEHVGSHPTVLAGGFEDLVHEAEPQPSRPLAPSQSSTALSQIVMEADSSERLTRQPSSIDVRHPDPVTVDVVGRHLVTDSSPITSQNDEEFDSLQLQGGDISRDLYNWRRSHSPSGPQRRRSHSFNGSVNSQKLDPDFQVHDIRVPGGFRRSFLVQKASRRNLIGESHNPTFFTKNFIEFLSLYGHFAGEELRDDEDEEEEEEEADEESLLLPSVPRRRRDDAHRTSTTKAVLLLLKAFIGTGVLFLPRGFRNAGWLFSVSSLLFFGLVSYWCFMLLINTRKTLGTASYGDIGSSLFGSKMRYSILTSIVLSQIGFAAAYIVFTATNLRAFMVSAFNRDYSIEMYIFLQLAIFIPLSLTRKIAKLSGTALVADIFILLGLIYVYYYCCFVSASRGFATVKTFNNDWTVFIGTAIFTYEGIGLLIPIQESMKSPNKFPVLLGWVMFTATVVFISSGLVGYLAFGEDTDTVILLNFPQDSIYVSIVQFLYAMAILLSTPLQLFPAIRILENGLFERSGKHNNKVKWRKNYFRIALVLITALSGWVGAANLDKFVSVIGSVACVPLIYIYPPLLHYKMENTSSLAKKLDLLIAGFGTLMMVYTSAQTALTWNS